MSATALDTSKSPDPIAPAAHYADSRSRYDSGPALSAFASLPDGAPATHDRRRDISISTPACSNGSPSRSGPSIVSVPVRMDNGQTESFIGFRVQHSLTSGPAKGGLRYHPAVDLGEVAALAMWMSWKCGIMNLPFGGGKGRHRLRPGRPVPRRKGAPHPPLHRRSASIIGPRQDVMAPDMGTDEQTMAWIMDTYSTKVGYACPEIVTGKPVELGGCVGRREATGRGVVYCVMRRSTIWTFAPESATAVVQGFGNVGSVAAQELHLRGVKVIAVSDRYGAIRNDKASTSRR